jgi:hypothetical protein
MSPYFAKYSMGNDKENSSDISWSKIFGYSNVDSIPESLPCTGEIRVTEQGELEVYHEGSWIPKY